MENKVPLSNTGTDNPNLTKQSTSAVKWLGIVQLIQQFISFGVSVALARLLVPRDFGLVGMSAVVIGFAAALSGLGLSDSIIYHKNIDDDHLNSAFWGGICFGTLLFFITFCFAPIASQFYNESKLKSIIIIAGLAFIMNPTASVHVSLLQKDLRFKEISLVTFVSFLVSAFISLAMAFAGFGVWSLVVGHLLASPVATLLNWNRVNWKPQFRFKWRKFKELLSFGINVALQSLVNFGTANFDYMIIGKFAGANALGVYTIAYYLMTKPLTQISPIITRVLFPAFSQIQDDDERIRKAYLRASNYIALVSFPIMSGLFIASDELIIFFYGIKWTGVIPILKILCVVGALKSIGTMVGSVQNAKGRPDIGLKWNIFVLLIYIPSFSFSAYYWGSIGVAWTILLLSFPLFILSQFITNKLINLKFLDYISNLRNPFLLSAAMIIVVLIFKEIAKIYTSEDYAILSLTVLTGVTSYISLIYFFNRSMIHEFKSIIR